MSTTNELAADSPIMVGKIIDATGTITAALYLITGICGLCALVTLRWLHSILFPKALRRVEQPAVQAKLA